MAVTRKDFVSAVLQNSLTVRAYKKGYDGRGKDGFCDCIGLIRGAFSILGVSYNTPGTNYTARHDIDGFTEFNSIFELKLGDVVLKRHRPGEEGYDADTIKRSYANDPDQNDYYHIGVVTSMNPFAITHCTSVPGGIQKDNSKKNWFMKGRMKLVKEDEEQGGGGTVKRAIVIANQGSTVNLRAEPNKSAPILVAVKLGQEVDILEEGTTWCKVKYEELTGYMMTEFLMVVADIGEGEGEGFEVGTDPIPPDQFPITGYVTVKMPENLALQLWEILDGVVGKG